MDTDTKRFLYKLIPPRPTFVQDMTEAERKAMEEHAIYWKGLIDRGIAIIFGLVLDPKGPWGVAIVEVADESEHVFLAQMIPQSKRVSCLMSIQCPSSRCYRRN